MAQAAGQTVYPEDYTNFAPGDVTKNILGEEVVIDPATPIKFSLYGTEVTIRTHAKTVADLLKEKHITLTKDDTLKPAINTPITAATVVSLVRNGTQVINVEQAIAAPIQYVNDPSLTLGATAVRQNGSPGKEEVTYKVVTKKGEVVSKTKIRVTVITQPVAQIVARGTTVFVASDKTSVMATAGISSGSYGYVDFIISHESNWNPYSVNAYSGACGLAQEYPCGKSGCSLGDAVCQLRWANGYANKYGGWAGAYYHWVALGSW